VNDDEGDVDERPWDRPGVVVRRDVEPHRGGQLRALGVFSLFCGVFAPVLVAPAVIALPLSVAVWAVAWSDLRRMAGGAKDPGGRAATEGARDCGGLSAVLSLLAVPTALFLAAVLGLRPGVWSPVQPLRLARYSSPIYLSLPISATRDNPEIRPAGLRTVTRFTPSSLPPLVRMA
jgi:hypothetical protein